MQAYVDALQAALAAAALSPWDTESGVLARQRLVEAPHGDMPVWQSSLARLPPGPAPVELKTDTLQIGEPGSLSATGMVGLETALAGLMPWRKGPFSFFGLHIDTEWRSDWKWQRVLPHLAPLAGRRVLDVGCGSGYHCWRMLGEGAGFVLGIDPTLLFLMQFLAVRRYLPEAPVWLSPVRLEELSPGVEAFDTVFSMGVLYHRRSPLDHLLELKSALRPGGELVLETLVVEGDAQRVLMPADRYAAMRNVYFLPSAAMLVLWLTRCGFRNVRVVDEAVTTLEEQRATPWMRFQSLADFLDPQDSTLTREGYPAPRRAVVIAEKP